MQTGMIRYAMVCSIFLLFVGCLGESESDGGWELGEELDLGAGDTGIERDLADPVDGGGGRDLGGPRDAGLDAGPGPDAGTDAGACGVADDMCDWDCHTIDPDCDLCPAIWEFTDGPYDAMECQIIDLGCPEGGTYSDDVCGCGCLEPLSECPPQDARGEGPCALVLGVAWDGDSCESLSGCNCVGDDCDAVYDSLEACQRDYLDCGAELRCGGMAAVECPDDMYCEYPMDSCGGLDGMGVCRQRPTACPPVEGSFCGCDGQFYDSACAAHAVGVDVWADDDMCLE